MRIIGPGGSVLEYYHEFTEKVDWADWGGEGKLMAAGGALIVTLPTASKNGS